MATLHCALENEADLHLNEREKIRHYRARYTEERSVRRIRRKKKKSRYFFYFARCVCKLRYYSDVIHSLV